jgi:hypothetical protein
MKCESQTSLLARTFASPYLGRKPKAKVVKVGVPMEVGIYLINHKLKVYMWYDKDNTGIYEWGLQNIMYFVEGLGGDVF